MSHEGYQLECFLKKFDIINYDNNVIPFALNDVQDRFVEDFEQWNHIRAIKRRMSGLSTLLLGYGMYLKTQNIDSVIVVPKCEMKTQMPNLIRDSDSINLPDIICATDFPLWYHGKNRQNIVLMCDEVAYCPIDIISEIAMTYREFKKSIMITSGLPAVDFMFGNKLRNDGYILTHWEH